MVFFLITRVYDIIEYTLLALYFSYHIRNKAVRIFTIVSIVPFIAFCLYDYFSSDTLTFAFLPLVIECLTLLIILLYILYEKMSFSFVIPIYQTSFFWISVAFIIYFAGNFFLFLYSENSYNDEVFKKQYTLIYSFVTIMKNILLCIGISIKENKQPDLSDNTFFENERLSSPFKTNN